MKIGDIAKNSKEQINVSIAEYNRHKFIDLRVYYLNERDEWKPTRKGICLKPDLIDEVIEYLEKAKKEC